MSDGADEAALELRRGVILGELELRRSRGRRRIKGRFPYRRRATISAGGNGRRPRKEEFAPRAFAFAVDDPEREIHLLIGHDFNNPLASKRGGSLVLRDSDEALTFDAEISPALEDAPFFRNAWAQLQAGLIAGISPGFRIPPPEAVPNAEEVIEEAAGQGRALIRIIRAAVLFELSLVARPAYEETEVEGEGEEAEARGAVVDEPARLIRPAALQWR